MEFYVIKGHTGEWEDACSWYVGLDGKTTAFEEEELAQSLCTRLNYIVRNLGPDIFEEHPEDMALMEYIRKDYDENLVVDYTGVHYYVERFSLCFG